MRVSVSVGEYAKVPYCVPGLEVEVSSMEELCYCIRENAFLLDGAFLDDGLLNWIEKECGLGELVKKLHPLVHKKGTLSMFAAAILRYVGFYDEETIQETARVLKQGAGLSRIEKRKSQIDYLVKNKRYRLGIRGYDELLEKWQEPPEGTEEGALAARGFLAGIWHNKGVAFAGMMLYDKAAECFRQAYELDGNKEDCMDYLAARRMQLSEGEYVSFAAEHKELYQSTLELEKRMEQYVQEWETQPNYLRICNMQEIRSGGDRQRYIQDSQRLIRALKESYRKCQRSND